MMQVRIILQRFQQLQTGHFRHQQVEQDNGKRLPVGTHFLKGFPSVFGEDHFISILQDHTEHLPVDHFVVGD